MKEIKVDTLIFADEKQGHGSRLIAYPFGSYDVACGMQETHLALPSPLIIDHNPPVIIEKTGRTIQRKHGFDCVRIKITWVKPEPYENQSSGGWAVI